MYAECQIQHAQIQTYSDSERSPVTHAVTCAHWKQPWTQRSTPIMTLHRNLIAEQQIHSYAFNKSILYIIIATVYWQIKHNQNGLFSLNLHHKKSVLNYWSVTALDMFKISRTNFKNDFQIDRPICKSVGQYEIGRLAGQIGRLVRTDTPFWVDSCACVSFHRQMQSGKMDNGWRSQNEFLPWQPHRYMCNNFSLRCPAVSTSRRRYFFARWRYDLWHWIEIMCWAGRRLAS